MFNREHFDLTEYGDKRIIKESVLITKTAPPHTPSYFLSHLKRQEVEDETDLVQFGQVDNLEFHHLENEELRLSSWTDDLSKIPNGKRKFTSVMIMLDPNKKVTVRQTYGLLDYFGDIGGLIDFLYYLGAFVLHPLWQFLYSSHMLSSLFRAKPDSQAYIPERGQLA